MHWYNWLGIVLALGIFPLAAGVVGLVEEGDFWGTFLAVLGAIALVVIGAAVIFGIGALITLR
jgi:hypothetical protein